LPQTGGNGSVRARGPCAGDGAVLADPGAAAAAAGARVAAAERVHWGKAEPVPGLDALNKGYDASVAAISCWGAGGCVVGGFFTDKGHHS
jgi:hypothetical protein